MGMMSTSPSSELYSHPGKLLEEHLIGTYLWAKKYIDSIPLFQENPFLETVTLLSVLFHDIGKGTCYFQQYLQESDSVKTSELINHSLLSSLFFLYFIEQNKVLPEDENLDFLRISGFVAIRKHHGDLTRLYDILSSMDHEDFKLALKQTNGIEESRFITLWQNLKLLVPQLNNMQEDLQGFKSWLINQDNGIAIRFRKTIRNLDKNQSITPFLIMNAIYSVLTLSDLSDVFYGPPEEKSTYPLTEETVEKYIELLGKNEELEINKLRNLAFSEVKEFDMEDLPRILLLNLPTGLGKTLLSLYLAVKIKNKKKLPGKIIYTLPFLSIIDQNYAVFEKVLESGGFNPNFRILLKHHHLAPPPEPQESEENYTIDLLRFIMESWNSEIVVTTFVQLFMSMFNNKKSTLKRFISLSNSVLILDEVQAIPVRYWELIRTVLKELTQKFNIYIIIATATTPLIFNKDEDRIASVCKGEFYFSKLNRVKLIYHDEVMKFEDFLLKEKNNISSSDTLIIANTINSAKQIYYGLKELGFDEREVTFLSSHIIPKERSKRITEIKRSVYKFVVSTQLVEAGVDIDFHQVYRDIAPLDSIIQSAGRCNRNGRRMGIIKVIKLHSEKDELIANRIYDPILVDITLTILSKYGPELPESQFSKIINEYYNMVLQRISMPESKEILNAIYLLDYTRHDGKSSIQDFSLIEEKFPEVSVFIEFDEEAEDVWKYLTREVIPLKDPIEKRNAFDKVKKTFYDYLITVPKNTRNLPEKEEHLDLYYVKRQDLNDFYDPKTGYILKLEGTETFCV
jgi:CRISPR-associated endonuclease/helicase Cas3